ncbi:hypothetical protein [Rhodoferax sp. GW822-FHT02A01]|uniref:hypothetical protein n=1 Tax=Rhodoferax sp. GW822-FHT02A01 TaxID=3141537 RepID=UPI00315D1770
MSLSQKDLSFIQKAGQAARNASEAIGHMVRAQGEVLIANLSSQPFGTDSDQVIERFKSLSGLSQGLVAVESQLQKLYALANELASPAEDVIVLRAVSKRRSISNAAAVDVIARPAKAAKKVKAVRKAGRKSTTPGALTANDSKLLSYLQGVLKADAGTAITGAAMAAGSKLPLGSVGISLKRLQATGSVKLVGRGIYQLGSNSVDAVAESAPVKRAKAVAKKAKAAKVEKPVAKVAKPQASRKAKVAAKKSKVAEPAVSAPTVDEATAPA